MISFTIIKYVRFQIFNVQILHTSGAIRSHGRKGNVRSNILTLSPVKCLPGSQCACQRTCQWSVFHTLGWLRPWLTRSPKDSIDLLGWPTRPSSLLQILKACLDLCTVLAHAGPPCMSAATLKWYTLHTSQWVTVEVLPWDRQQTGLGPLPWGMCCLDAICVWAPAPWLWPGTV